MARALAITELARAGRTQAGLKVRQPLSRILVAGGPADGLDEALLEVIRDEINVKQVDFVPPAAILGARLKPIFKALGPRFGGDVNKAASAIKAVGSDAVRAGQPDGVWRVTVDGHGEVEILATEVEIEEFALEGFALAEDAGLKVALDTRLTAPLTREGMVRELVHRLQNLRKEQGLAITDRVSVRLGMVGVLAEAVEEHRAYAQAELLADVFEIGSPGGPGDTWDVEGEAVTVRLERVRP
jgi:isoleucyl-tRNA synthetase